MLEDLVRGSDAVFSNLRGDGPAKLGLRYEDLKDVNPRIVCCSLSGFGMTGPRAAEPAYDNLMQALAGWMSVTGEPDGPPTRSGLSLVDLSGGYVAAIALLSGLLARTARRGRAATATSRCSRPPSHELMYLGTWAASRGFVPPRRPNSSHPSIVPFQSFATADGWIAVACPKEPFWRALCDALARPEWAEGSRA